MTPAARAFILPGLAVVAASVDAISYLGLGHVFTANMTGNTALLGIGIATGKTGAMLRSAAALAGFVAGAVFSNLFLGRGRFLGRCLAFELLPVAAWLGWWLAEGDPAQGVPRYGYILLAGFAMGLQSGAVTWLGVPGVTTVFIAGTITSLAVDLTARLRGRTLPQQDRYSHLLQGLVLCFFLIGALAGALAFRHWGGAAVAVPLSVLAALAVTVFLLPPDPEDHPL